MRLTLPARATTVWRGVARGTQTVWHWGDGVVSGHHFNIFWSSSRSKEHAGPSRADDETQPGRKDRHFSDATSTIKRRCWNLEQGCGFLQSLHSASSTERHHAESDGRLESAGSESSARRVPAGAVALVPVQECRPQNAMPPMIEGGNP